MSSRQHPDRPRPRRPSYASPCLGARGPGREEGSWTHAQRGAYLFACVLVFRSSVGILEFDADSTSQQSRLLQDPAEPFLGKTVFVLRENLMTGAVVYLLGAVLSRRPIERILVNLKAIEHPGDHTGRQRLEVPGRTRRYSPGTEAQVSRSVARAIPVSDIHVVSRQLTPSLALAKIHWLTALSFLGPRSCTPLGLLTQPTLWNAPRIGQQNVRTLFGLECDTTRRRTSLGSCREPHRGARCTTYCRRIWTN